MIQQIIHGQYIYLLGKVVKKSEAKNVFFHHGDSEALSKYLVEKESINVLFLGK